MIWGFSLHGWEDVMRASLAIAGVFGLIVGLSTWFVVKLQREEITASKQEFDSYKLETEKKISEANAAGKSAKADAAKATATAEAEQVENSNLKRFWGQGHYRWRGSGHWQLHWEPSPAKRFQ